MLKILIVLLKLNFNMLKLIKLKNIYYLLSLPSLLTSMLNLEAFVGLNDDNTSLETKNSTDELE